MNLEKHNLSFEEALAEVNYCLTSIGQMGGNDYEVSELTALIKELENKIITPQEAKSRAHKILNSKMDYH